MRTIQVKRWMLGAIFGRSLELCFDISSWLVGFGWVHGCITELMFDEELYVQVHAIILVFV